MSEVRVATFNSPGRLAPHRAAFAALAAAGVDVIAAQEHRDADDWAPPGWRVYRPRAARSTAVYWNPATVTARRHGHTPMSSPRFHEHRGLTWVHFTTPIGPLRVASAHPPAFKTSRPAHAVEYRRQLARMARWLGRGRFRVIAGDVNGKIPSTWTRPLSKVGRWSRPLPSGPGRKPLDYVGVAARGPYRIVSARLGDPGRSDHRPVIVTLARR